MTLRTSGLTSNLVLSGALAGVLAFAASACSSEDPNVQCIVPDGGTSTGTGGQAPGSGGAAGSGGEASSGGAESGGASSTGGKAAGTGGKAPGTGGKSGGTGGQQGSGGTPNVSSDWVKASPNGSEDVGCVVVNRLTGDVFADISGGGVYKSTDQGGGWTRVDGGKVSGVCVMGPGFDVDQDSGDRMAVWSLDGNGAWTNDGTTWLPIANIARNWDMGSIDWAAADPKTMIVARHEAEGETFLSTDSAVTWDLMGIRVFASPGPPPHAMVGVMDATTLIYSEGSPGGGIHRSTNTGSTFAKVSDFDPKTRVPVLFNGVFYLGTGEGLIVSTNKGATWERQGAVLDMWVGPFFGANENEIMIANSDGVYLSFNAGDSWSKVATIPEGRFDPKVLGSYAWDHIGKVVYAAALQRAVLKLEL